MRFSRALIQICAAAFDRVLPLERPADKALSSFFRSHSQLGQRDRALVAETVYAALRHRRRLEALVDGVGTTRRVLAVWAVLLGANLRELEPFLQREELEWLAALKKKAREPQPLEVECDLPDWAIERLRGRFGADQLRAIAAALNRAAPLDLRVNLLKLSREAVIEQLSRDGLAPAATSWSPAGVRLPGRPAIQRHPLYQSGAIEVQDEGSQLVCYLVAPKRGEMVADYCAGAGGKTLALGMLMRSTGRVYAFDVSAARLAKLGPRLARSGLSNVYPARIAGDSDARLRRLAGKMDRVLVDAPCSGLGTVRRNPDLKWRRSPADVDELAEKQKALLASAARLVKPGGRLIYATCSFLEEENQQVVEAFLLAQPQFRRLPAGEILAAQKIALATDDYLELWPHRHGTDAFFAAVLERAR